MLRKLKFVVTCSKHDMQFYKDTRPMKLHGDTVSVVDQNYHLALLVCMKKRRTLTKISSSVETQYLDYLVLALHLNASSLKHIYSEPTIFLHINCVCVVADHTHNLRCFVLQRNSEILVLEKESPN